MTHNVLRVVLGALVFALSGCIYLPIIEPEPYKQDQLGKIHIGKTTRQEIVDMFGREGVARNSDSVWIYGQSRHVGYLIIIIPMAKEMPHGYLEDYQFFVLEFDHDIVSHMEFIETAEGCSSTGICLVHHVLDRADRRLSDKSIISSEREDDHLAKAFLSVPDMCSLYIYTRSSVASIEMDSNPVIFISNETYLHFLLKPGAHKLRAIGPQRAITEQVIDCLEDEIIFVEQYLETGIFTKNKLVIEITEESIGRDAILSKNLVLSNLADQFQAQQYPSLSGIRDVSETCSVYVYCTEGCFLMVVKLNELESYALDEGLYLQSEIRPGPILVTAIYRYSGRQYDLKFDCEGKTSKFVRVKYDTSFFGSGTVDLKLVDESKVRDAVKKRIRVRFNNNAE